MNLLDPLDLTIPGPDSVRIVDEYLLRHTDQLEPIFKAAVINANTSLVLYLCNTSNKYVDLLEKRRDIYANVLALAAQRDQITEGALLFDVSDDAAIEAAKEIAKDHNNTYFLHMLNTRVKADALSTCRMNGVCGYASRVSEEQGDVIPNASLPQQDIAEKNPFYDMPKNVDGIEYMLKLLAD